jgi:transcriptional regulator with XRE-family HTH domain
MKVPMIVREEAMMGAGLVQEVEMVRLEDLRRRRALTQQALAEQAGIAVKTVWMIEGRKRSRYQPRIMRAVAKALGIRMEDVDEFRDSLGLGPAEG